MQNFYRVASISVTCVFLVASLILPAYAVSLTPGEDGVPEEARQQIIQLSENPAKVLEPQDREISVSYVGSALWQGMNVACGSGDYIYGYPYLGLQVIDVSDPANPEVIAEYHHPANPQDVVVAGDFVYVAAAYNVGAEYGLAAGYDHGLLIFDVSDPYAPVLASSITTAEGISLDGHGVEVVGNTAYLSAGKNFVVIDVSDPYSPQVTNVIDPLGLALNAAIIDNYAYIASKSYLELWDLSADPTPVNLGSKAYSESTYDVVASGNLLYVAGGGQDLYIVNAADHSLPLSPLGSWQGGAWPEEVEIAGDYAYLHNYGSMKIVDVSTPTNPVLASDLQTDGHTHSLYVSGSNLYVSDWISGVDLYDISSPAAPALEAEYVTAGLGSDLAVSGDYGFEANGDKGLQVLDLSQPESPNVVASYDTPGYAQAVAVAGNALYLTDDTAGVMVFDVSDPLTPGYVESIEVLPYTIYDIAIAGGYAYFVKGDTLLVYDISSPLSPVRAASIYTGYTRSFAINGNYAYMSIDYTGLQIVDITDPASPQLAGACAVDDFCYAIGIVGSYAYLGGFDGRINIVDVSDPENPTLAGRYQLPAEAYTIDCRLRNMQLVGDYLYLAFYGSGLQVLNVGDPLSPYLAGSYNTLPAWAWDVDVVGDYVYVTCDNGFLVLQQTVCHGPDGAGGFNIADAVYLIHYIFMGGPGPDPLETGDLNCDGAVNLGDAVYLIDFIFRNGPPPCGGCY